MIIGLALEKAVVERTRPEYQPLGVVAMNAVVTGGDRVALVPPGGPGPYRALLGFKKLG